MFYKTNKITLVSFRLGASAQDTMLLNQTNIQRS